MVARHDWPVDIHPLPPLLHNRPHLIADEVRRLAVELASTYDAVAVGYADCGTYGALDAVCDELGLEHRDVQQVLLAGSFGSYLSPASAVRIGLVPKLPVLRIVAAGNVAGEGAKMALLSVRERAGALALLEEVTYVELSDRPDFNDAFVDQLSFTP